MKELTCRGNRALLDGEMIGFLAAGRIAPLSILPTLDCPQSFMRERPSLAARMFPSAPRFAILLA